MKRSLALLLCALLLVFAAGCAGEVRVKQTVTGGIRAYSEMTDGSWLCEGHSYRYRLEISGRMPNAATDSTFTYLSNLEEIPFDRAYKAAGISSMTEDYFSPEEAILVDMR